MNRVPLSVLLQKDPLVNMSIFAFARDETQWGYQYAQFYNDDKFSDVNFVIYSAEK